MQERYLYGQGQLKLALITAGVVGPFFWVGDVSALSLAFAEEKASHKESYSGQRSKVREFNISNDLTVSATMHDFNAANMARFTNGTSSSTASGTVTAESLGTITAGDEITLANIGVSSVVITDSNGSPATIAETHYDLDPKFGNIKFNTLPTTPAPTMPLKAAYSYAAYDQVSFLTTTGQQVALRYEGINLAEGGAPVVVDIYKLSPGLLQELALITSGNDVAGMQVTGAVLRDSSKSQGGALGQYGRIRQVAA